jgi:thioredoxin 2
MPDDLVRCPKCGRRNRLPAAAAGSPRCGHCRQPLPWITHAGDHTFAEIAEAAAIPVLVDLWAPWCGPCRRANPALARLAAQMAGQVKLVMVNLHQSPRLRQRFSVLSVPTLLVLRRAQVVARRAGVAPEEPLRAWLNRALQVPPAEVTSQEPPPPPAAVSLEPGCPPGLLAPRTWPGSRRLPGQT